MAHQKRGEAELKSIGVSWTEDGDVKKLPTWCKADWNRDSGHKVVPYDSNLKIVHKDPALETHLSSSMNEAQKQALNEYLQKSLGREDADVDSLSLAMEGNAGFVNKMRAVNVGLDYLRNYLYVEAVAEVRLAAHTKTPMINKLVRKQRGRTGKVKPGPGIVECAKFYLSEQLLVDCVDEAGYIAKLIELGGKDSSVEAFSEGAWSERSEEALEEMRRKTDAMMEVGEGEAMEVDGPFNRTIEASDENQHQDDHLQSSETKESADKLVVPASASRPNALKQLQLKEQAAHQKLQHQASGEGLDPASDPNWMFKKPHKQYKTASNLPGKTESLARWRFTSDTNAVSVRERTKKAGMKIMRLKSRQEELAIVAESRKAGGRKGATEYLKSVRKKLGDLDLGGAAVNSRSSIAKEYFAYILEKSKKPYGAEDYCRITLEEAVRICLACKYGTLQAAYQRMAKYGFGFMQRTVPRRELARGTNIRNIPIVLEDEVFTKRLYQPAFQRPNEASPKLRAWYPMKKSEIRRYVRSHIVTTRHGKNWGYNFRQGFFQLRNPPVPLVERTMTRLKLSRKKSKAFLAATEKLPKRRLKRFEPCFRWAAKIDLHLGDEHNDYGGQRARLRNRSRWAGLGHFARPLYNETGELPLYGFRQSRYSANPGSSYPLGRVKNPPSAAAAWGARKDEILRYQELLLQRGALSKGTTVVETKSPNIDRLNLRRFFNDEQVDTFEAFGLPFDMFFEALDREGNGVIDLQLLTGYSDAATLEWKQESQMATRLKKTGGFKQLKQRLPDSPTSDAQSSPFGSTFGASATFGSTMSVGGGGGLLGASSSSAGAKIAGGGVVAIGDGAGGSAGAGAGKSVGFSLKGGMLAGGGAAGRTTPGGGGILQNKPGQAVGGAGLQLVPAGAREGGDESCMTLSTRNSDQDEDNDYHHPRFLVRQSAVDGKQVSCFFRFRDLFVQFYLPHRARKPAGFAGCLPGKHVGSFAYQLPAASFRAALSPWNAFRKDLVAIIWQEAKERYIARGERALSKSGLVRDSDLASELFFRTLSERNCGVHESFVDAGRDLATLKFLDQPDEVDHSLPFEVDLGEKLLALLHSGSEAMELFSLSLLDAVNDPLAIFAEPIRIDVDDELEKIPGFFDEEDVGKKFTFREAATLQDARTMFKWVRRSKRGGHNFSLPPEVDGDGDVLISDEDHLMENLGKMKGNYPPRPRRCVGRLKLNWDKDAKNPFSRDLPTAMKESLFGELFPAAGEGGQGGAVDPEKTSKPYLNDQQKPREITVTASGITFNDQVDEDIEDPQVPHQHHDRKNANATAKNPPLNDHPPTTSSAPSSGSTSAATALTFSEFANLFRARQTRIRELRRQQLADKGPLPRRNFVTRDKAPAPESELGKLYAGELGVKAKALGLKYTPGLAAAREKLRRDFTRIGVHDPTAPGEKQAMMQDQIAKRWSERGNREQEQ
eukprot:g4095.t1